MDSTGRVGSVLSTESAFDQKKKQGKKSNLKRRKDGTVQ